MLDLTQGYVFEKSNNHFLLVLKGYLITGLFLQIMIKIDNKVKSKEQ